MRRHPPTARLMRAEHIPRPVPDLARLRAAVLVPHAMAKCPACGSTLVADPLPHRCIPSEVRSDFWRYLA